MHRTLARQLRRLCGVEAEEALPALAEEMAAVSRAGGVSPELGALLSGLPELLGRIDRTYEQHERDIELRYRSLEVSSSELLAANERVRLELAGRNRILESLQQAAAALLGHRGGTIEASIEDDLDALSTLLPKLAQEQEANRLELANLRFTMDQHAIVSTTDTEGHILFVNDKFCQISGYSREELLGQNHRMITSAFHPKSFFENMWGTISEGRVWHGEIRNRAKDGRIYWVDATIVPFLDATGAPQQYIAARTEITALKEMEEALRRAQSRLEKELAESERSEALTRSILDTAVDGILTIDEKGVVQTVNAAVERLFGYPAEEVIGNNVSLLMPEPDHSAHDGYLRHYRESGERRVIGRGREVEGRRRDGTRFPLYLSVGEMQVGHQRRFTGILQDITERHEVDRLKKQFVSTVSHELRTPLTSLRGSLGLLTAGAVGELPASAGEVVAIAERSTVRLIDLINDILDLERMDAGRLSLDRRPTPLRPVLEAAVETVEALAIQHGVAIELPDADGLVLGDRDRLIQVVVNLLSNAIKFSPKGGRVPLGVRREGPSVRFEVSDEGRGVPPGFGKQIFEPFRQVEGSDARQKGGTGLGLAICRSIVEQHGGAIGVEDREGPGATFWFTVPVAESDSGDEGETAS
jgi:PAS domain S-box-containing protein